MNLPAQPAVHSFRWIGFFLVLGTLATTAVVLPIVYNLDQQLRPEQLTRARTLWRERGLADYDLTFAITYDRETQSERHLVQVRAGRIVVAAAGSEIVQLAPAVRALVGLPAGGLGRERAVDVPGMFDRLEQLLAEQNSDRPNFLVAVFDPNDGHPRRFIRRVRGTREREEWNVKLTPARP